MPRNKFGGNKAKRSKNHVVDKEMVYKDGDDQFYAQVTKILGNCRVELFCFGDNKIRIGHIRGNMKKRVWINDKDIVLVSVRDFQDNKCDVIHKYDEDHIRKLKNLGELEKETEEKECSFEFDRKENQACDFEFDEI